MDGAGGISIPQPSVMEPGSRFKNASIAETKIRQFFFCGLRLAIPSGYDVACRSHAKPLNHLRTGLGHEVF